MRISIGLVVFAAACGVLGDPGGAPVNLPTSGASGYGKISDPTLSTPIDEPYVVVDSRANLTDGSVFLTGGVFRLFFTRTPTAGGASEIWYVDLAGLHAKPVAGPAAVLVADQAWEGGNIRAPAVYDAGDGRVFLFYEGAQGIGQATSTDGGVHWAKSGVVLAGGSYPAITRVNGVWYLYFTKRSAPGVFVATSEDGTSFSPNGSPVLLPTGDATFFDSVAVGQPSVIGGTTTAGQVHVGMFYVGTSVTGVQAIGYAASDDALHFERANKGVAILDPPSPSEMGPAGVFEPTQAVLFFNEQRAGVWAIAAATSP